MVAPLAGCTDVEQPNAIGFFVVRRRLKHSRMIALCEKHKTPVVCNRMIALWVKHRGLLSNRVPLLHDTVRPH